MTSDEYQDLRTWLSNLSEGAGERVAEACLGKPSAKYRDDWRWGRNGGFRYRPSKKRARCFVSGQTFDLIELAIHSGHASDFFSAVRFIESVIGGLAVAPPESPPETPAPDKSEKARAIWAQTTALTGTFGAVYYPSRAIPGPWPVTLRFHPALWCHEVKRELPAIVAAVVALDDPKHVRAIQRRYLGPDGRKAKLETPKKSLGPCSGNGVILGRIDDTVCVAEGIESALSASRALGLPAVATLGTSGMAALRIPERIRRITIAFDRDQDGAGERAANALAERMMFEGRKVEFRPPPDRFGDWNDWAMAQALGVANV